MKRIILFFTVCLGLSVSQTTFADDADVARAASKRGTTTVSSASTTSRSISSVKRPDNSQNASKNARTAAKPQQRVVSRTATVKPRETATLKTVSVQQQPKRVSTVSRAASSRAVNARQTESTLDTSSARSATKKTNRVVRAAELNSEKITNIKSLNYSKCKTVYYECMDEFCANKDTNLRRCACSSRIHEFDGIKKQLADAEDKMLDFNQRLLTVSLDKEDAAAINVASEGELAFEKKDTSESEKLLQKITQTLNNSGNSKINNDLSAISLSLDMDTAWDSVDSMAGIATSSKNGVDLYNAARPICIEMAREVCSDDELDIAQNGYKLSIQQDCNTVAKSYDTLYNNAMEKIHESGALLDMSRLNVYQQRNSDDTLTCKKKILAQLSDAAVCGENLYKCLDTTGQYIDPSTGAAFLSEDLYKMSDLLQEPGTNEQWSKINQNANFVNFLNSKKEFLEPAMEQCQDISDTIWKEFLDDALAQIKLAQNAKMEEIRQSCTTLIAECKTNALSSLSEFDSRALSTFSVAADKTANSMCSEIQESCISLMNNNGVSTDWEQGITGIATDISYQKVLETCTNIGRDCIVQQCNGTSGNFALCQKITDDNRRAILNGDACWQKVLDCVKTADNLENINLPTRDNYYQSVYGLRQAPEYNPCANDTSKACFITEQIWGNCEYKPDAYSITTNTNLGNDYKTSNKILNPLSGSSLLSWFATNTGTTNTVDSCNSNGCQIDFEPGDNGICTQLYTSNTRTTDGQNPTSVNQVINVTNNITNYCKGGILDLYGNCCTNAKDTNTGICIPGADWQAVLLQSLTCTAKDDHLCPVVGDLKLYCVTESKYDKPVAYYTDYSEYACGITANGTATGIWVIVDSNGNYMNPDSTSGVLTPVMFYRKNAGSYCQYRYNNGEWKWSDGCRDVSTPPVNNELLIEYTTSASLVNGTIN